MLVLPEFRSTLARFAVEDLESSGNPTYGLLPELILAYANPAYFRFARENNGEPAISERWSLGAMVVEAIDEEVSSYYEDRLLSALESGVSWEHEYECSSPTLYRRFHMRAYPVQGEGLIVVHSLSVEHEHDPEERPEVKPVRSVYTDEHDLIVQCVHCRRFLRQDGSSGWDWVPAWLNVDSPHFSGGLCSPCRDQYFGSSQAM